MPSEDSGPRAFLSFSFHRLSRRILMMAAMGVVAPALSAAAAALIVRMSSVSAPGAAQATAERRPLSPLPPMASDSTDPANPFADERDRGATPPHLYELTAREEPFHGVQALRLNPVGGGGVFFWRDGLLAHPYMLGPNGDSNGCVSFKDYDAFLRARGALMAAAPLFCWLRRRLGWWAESEVPMTGRNLGHNRRWAIPRFGTL